MDAKDTKIAILAASIPIIGACGFFGLYRVAKPTEYLVRTGFRINDSMGMRISRKAIALPFIQTLSRIPLQPRNLHFDLKCLSKEYLPFKMPVSYTFSPFDPTENPVTEIINGKSIETDAEILFKRYVQKMSCLEDFSYNATLLGIIHGETRVLAATMSIDAINDDREKFKTEVIVKIQQLLLPYGLRVDNANIAELTEEKREHGEMGYLEARERKKLSDAVQQSEINVAEATKCGDIGKKQNEAITRQEKAKLEADTQKIELQSKEQIAIAHADLAVVTADAKKREDISKVEGNAAAEQKKEELQAKIEEYKAENQLQAKRAEQLTSEKVIAECKKVNAEMERDVMVLSANGKAEAMRIESEAIRFKGEQEAAVILLKLEAEAKGKQALLEAQALGTQKLMESCESNSDLLPQVLNVYHSIPQKLAEENAKAVQGLNPQIWSLSGDDAGTQVGKMIAGLTPLFEMYKKLK